MEVDYGPDAKEQLKGLGRLTGVIVDRELRTLVDTRSFPNDFRRLDVQHDPPWWWVRLNTAYAAVVRSCSDDELSVKGVSGPRIVCGLLVGGEEDLRKVERQMIEHAKDVENDEEGR